MSMNSIAVENECLYDKYKRDLKDIYDNIAEGLHITSRCKLYEEGAKSSKKCNCL